MDTDGLHIALISFPFVLLPPVMLQRNLRVADFAAGVAGVHKVALVVLGLDVVPHVVLALVVEVVTERAVDPAGHQVLHYELVQVLVRGYL